ncbi:hypothetical protein TIFTF001_028315 [Ficus carica]|uniref:Uncharacterized protein n=1 Tax=Ficus carica TaxID=3494 RepID=A0AA88DPS1_FICCA|nr:hypothetical protein TIFTF001_028315 [Ficus carica]
MGVAETTSAPSASGEGVMGVAQCLGRGRRGQGLDHMTAQWLDQGGHGHGRGHQRAQCLERTISTRAVMGYPLLFS